MALIKLKGELKYVPMGNGVLFAVTNLKLMLAKLFVNSLALKVYTVKKCLDNLCYHRFLLIDAVMIFPETQFGNGNGNVSLYNVNCTGNERDIFECNYSSNGTCIDSVGVRCSNQTKLGKIYIPVICCSFYNAEHSGVTIEND